MRDNIYANAGTPEFFGISIMEINELGPNQKIMEAMEDLCNGGKSTGGSGHTGTTFAKTDDIAIGLDRSRESLFRAVATDAENGSELNLVADDQYSVRQSKIGYFGSMEEGRMILDDRVLTGIKVSL